MVTDVQFHKQMTRSLALTDMYLVLLKVSAHYRKLVLTSVTYLRQKRSLLMVVCDEIRLPVSILGLS